MGRLTIPDVRVDEHTTRRSVIDVAAVREHAMEFYCRLKAYEDTGIEPEAVETVKLALCAKHMVDLETLNNTPISRLVELAEADKDGRVVVLPPENYDWKIRGDIALGIITANCRRAEAARAMQEMEGKKDGKT